MKRKPIRIRGNVKDMTIEEVYFEGQALIYKKCKTWLKKYEFDDLHQVAFIGLQKAYDTYDIQNATAFLTYAGIIIDNELKMFNRKNDKYKRDTSLYADVKESDGDIEIVDMIADEQNVEDEAIASVLKEELRLEINKLKPIEKKVVEYKILGNITQTQIAMKMGISRTYVSQIYKRAISHLKEKLEAQM